MSQKGKEAGEGKGKGSKEGRKVKGMTGEGRK